MAKKERLDKILSNMGYGSRKDVKQFIKEGRVEVDNKLANKNSMKVDPYSSHITFNGSKVNYREYIYLMMNKPQGVVSSTDDPISETVLDLLEYQHLIFEPFPAGRLDKDTEGFIFITNDGKMAHGLLSPKRGIEKTYYAEVDGYVKKDHIDEFKEGVVLDDGYKTLPAKLEILESSIFSKVKLTITEGKYHQVKRMFEAIEMKVTDLKRISMGPLTLDEDLALGQYRELKEEEIQLLKEKIGNI